jgi:hypothetical protein
VAGAGAGLEQLSARWEMPSSLVEHGTKGPLEMLRTSFVDWQRGRWRIVPRCEESAAKALHETRIFASTPSLVLPDVAGREAIHEGA